MNFFVLFTVFAILFLGELGDRSQLIIFNLVLEMDKKPYKIGIGASLGFAAIITIGVLFGNLITSLIPVSIIAFISGLLFIIIGILEIKDLKTQYNQMKYPKENINDDTIKETPKNDRNKPNLEKIKSNPYFAGFMSIFIMELGDKTQLLTISFVSIYALPFEVWLGSFLALSTLAWIGVFFGTIILKYIPKFYIKIITIIIFIIVGLFLVISNIN